MASEASAPVRVAVRVRPPLPREINANGEFHSCLGCAAASTGNPKLFITNKDEPVLIRPDGTPSGDPSHLRQFTFDYIFDQALATEDVYRRSCEQLVRNVLLGVNATIFAYGQTGTGKTHTMLGDDKQPGVILHAAHDLLAAVELEDGNVDLEISYVQVYLSTVTDLLSTKKPMQNLNVREDESGEIFVEGVSKHTVTSLEDVTRLIDQGSKRRKVASTKLNSTSSRSHAVLTFHVTVWSGMPATNDDSSEMAIVAKLNLVDLAGSERVKDSEVGGQDLKDACSINLSLFHLAGVVQALIKKEACIPYKNDTLCFLLKDALGGNCLTTLVACVSPAQLHAAESLSTLGFAAACSRLQNKTKRNVRALTHNRPLGAKAPAAAKPPRPDPLPWEGVVAGDPTRCPGGRITLGTPYGALSALRYGHQDPGKPLAVLLHGHPSCAEGCYGHWGLIPALVFCGFQVVALDMPGRGESKGTQLKSRSEYNLDKNGACDVVVEVIKQLKARSALWVGYDWGAGIGLSAATSKQHRRFVDRVVAFHPSFQEQKPGDLKTVGCPVQVLWCKQDQFHNWTKWKPLAAALKASLGPKRYAEFIFDEPQWGTFGWSRHARQVERRVVQFLTGSDYGALPDKVHDRPNEDRVTTENRRVTQRANVVVLGDPQGPAAGDEIFRAADPQREAVATFASAYRDRRLPALYQAFCSGGDQKSATAALFGALPELSLESLADPCALVELGLWPRPPGGWHALQQTPRYFPGRQVLVQLPGVIPTVNSPDFMTLAGPASADATERYTTFKARLASPPACASEAAPDGPRPVWVEVAGAGGGSRVVPVSRAELERLNQPHALPKTPGAPHELRLEDGIRCNYKAPLTKAKMCEIALALGPIAAQLDFDAEAAAIEALQLQAIRTVRGALDLTTFQRDPAGVAQIDAARSRDRTRYCGDDAARFAVRGQGHCHTVSSVMFAFLRPFAGPLGLDVKYRGGFTFYKTEVVTKVANAPEMHQWLEISTRPSGTSYTCDLYAEDGPTGGRGYYLAAKVEETYEDYMYPNGIVKLFSGQHGKVVPARPQDYAEGL